MNKCLAVALFAFGSIRTTYAAGLECAFPDIHGRPMIESYERKGHILSEHLVHLGPQIGWFGRDYRIVRDDEYGIVAVGDTTESDLSDRDGGKVIGFGADVFLYDKKTGQAQITSISIGRTTSTTRLGSCKP